MGGYGFGTGIEPDAIQSQHVLVAKEGILISGEWEIGRGNSYEIYLWKTGF